MIKKMNKTELADWGEAKARSFLEKRSVQILATNFRSSSGEVDIIGYDQDDLVFFEVKTRSSTSFGFPEEAVNSTKIQKIELVANDYMDLFQLENENWRIDTIAIIRNPFNGKFQIKWFKNVEA